MAFLLGKSESEISALQEKLLELLSNPPHNGHSGNKALMRNLQWDEDQYWSIRDSLVDAGKIVTGRGKGGSVDLNIPLTEEVLAPVVIEKEVASYIQRENELYDPVSQVIRDYWVKDQRFLHHAVEVTASQGRRSTGGTWTRPDIVVAGLRMFTYLPNKFFDLITFEIKPSGNFDVTAVYEALSHRKAATQSYVWLHYREEQSEKALLERITKEAETHGIGLIIASDPSDSETWETLVEPLRVDPDPSALNEFIARQLSEGTKETLAQWVR